MLILWALATKQAIRQYVDPIVKAFEENPETSFRRKIWVPDAN